MRNGHDESGTEDMPHNLPHFPPMPPENITPQQLYAVMLSIHSQQAIYVAGQNDIKRQMQEMKQEQAEMASTFRAAKGVVQFIKLAGMIGTAILAIAGVLTLAK